MAIREADRLFMHEGLRECMTEKVADLLMEHLPPTGWADVARVQDLNQLEKNTDIQFVAVRSQIASLEKTMNTKFESVDTRFDNLTQMMNVQFSHINGRLDRMFQALLALAGATAAGFGVVAGIILTQR
jgi:hypothetical protein